MLIVETISTEAQFNELQGMWEALLKGSLNDSPFLSHDWFRCCLRSYGEGKEVCILTVRDESGLIGIAPLWRYWDEIRGVPIDRIGFITGLDTPFADFIVREEKREETLRAILGYFYTKKKGLWDVITLNQWPEESANCKVLQGIIHEQSKKCFKNVSSRTPYISINGEWESFLQSLSSRFRKTRRNILNRIRKLNQMEIQCLRQDLNGSAVKDILIVTGRSWKQNEGVAISSSEKDKEFFDLLTNVAGQRGWLLIWLLKVNNFPIAMEYDLEYGGKVYALRADYDESYKEYSPGSYLEYEIVRYLFEKGFLEYSFGPGLNNYKLHWTETCRENISFNICNNNFRGLLFWGMETKLLPTLRWGRGVMNQIGINGKQER